MGFKGQQSGTRCCNSKRYLYYHSTSDCSLLKCAGWLWADLNDEEKHIRHQTIGFNRHKMLHQQTFEFSSCHRHTFTPTRRQNAHYRKCAGSLRADLAITGQMPRKNIRQLCCGCRVNLGYFNRSNRFTNRESMMLSGENYVCIRVSQVQEQHFLKEMIRLAKWTKT